LKPVLKKPKTRSINMNSVKRILIGWTAALTFAPGALAEESGGSDGGLFVEPALTYEVGTTSVNYPSPFSSSSGTAEGLGIGGRLGFHVNEAFFVALDLRYSMPEFTDSSVEYDAKSVSTNWGPAVGFQMPNLGPRLWGGYILGGVLDPESSGSFDVKFEEAAGYRVGAGFRLFTLSLNLEYQHLKYGQTTLEQVGPFSGGSAMDNVNLTNKTWIASVSFPLEF
jgi:hypothetical protein